MTGKTNTEPEPGEDAYEPAEADAQRTRRAIGRRLAAVRTRQGLSVRRAAELAGLSRSFVTMVEKGASEIAVSRLIRLANVYNLGISDLLDGPAALSPEFMPANATRVFPGDGEAVRIRYLSSPSWEIQPFLVDLAPAGTLEDLRHPGDEFIHCLTGLPTVVVDGTAHLMHPGDTITLPSRATHSYINSADAPAQLIGGVRRYAAPE
ncbi:MAG TPA: cupin domain-containing protein [Solirubrobacteraceae bacterium]|nr:cupin domain-containing protein [Solirubrobacteraceae bacterium]